MTTHYDGAILHVVQPEGNTAADALPPADAGEARAQFALLGSRANRTSDNPIEPRSLVPVGDE